MKTEDIQAKQKERKRSSGLGLLKQLIILALIPALIVGGFMSILLFRELDVKKQADQIKSIADYMVVANMFIHQLQKERCASAGYVASNGNNMSDIMNNQRQLTDKYHNALDRKIKSLDIERLGYKFARLLNTSSRNLLKLASIREKITSLPFNRNESNEFYSVIIDDIIGTFQEASVVIKDSELSYPLTACINLIMAEEMAGIERTLMTTLTAEDKPVARSDILKLAQVSNGQYALLAAFMYQATEEILREFHTKQVQTEIDVVNNIRRQIGEKLDKGDFGLKPEYVFAVTTGRIDDLKNVESIQLQEILKEANTLSSEKMVSVATYSVMTGVSTVVMFILCFFITKSITRPVSVMSKAAKRVAEGQLDHDIEIRSGGEIGELADSFNDMLHNLRLTTEKNDVHNWLRSGHMELSVRMRGEQDIDTLGRNIISCLTEYLNAKTGLLYMADSDNHLKLIGSYAYTQRKNISDQFLPGEGLVGQAAIEKKHILITDCPDSYFNIQSGLGEASPKNILIFPLIMNNVVKGVIELGSFHEFNDIHLTLLEQVSEGIAITMNSVVSSTRTKELLEKTRHQAEALQIREDELRQSNRELEENTKALKASESRLHDQQEELRQINEELEKKNRELYDAKKLVEKKAQEQELSNKYKSEFLANMSHELRTPLNSILLLSRLLADNKDGSLSENNVESLRSIYSSGNDLLELINDVLDLSKVEAGKMDIHAEEMYLRDFCNNIKRNFEMVAGEKGISLNIDIADGLPEYIWTDEQRVAQIVKNFLSNAFKFTSEGSVSVRITRPEGISDIQNELPDCRLDNVDYVSFSVIDTGIGIPEDKQELIFEAFTQADGTTNRKYGGTGLGLSISRELANLLKGHIHMKSTCGKGSVFTLCLPETLETETDTEEDAAEPEPLASKKPAMQQQQTDRKEAVESVKDDRRTLSSGDKSVLIIEDDSAFLRILRDLAHEHGFKCLVAGDGETGLHFADYYKPSGIILDLGLPGINGWTVMARLKDNPETRHIPVHFISASDKKSDAMKMGAIDYLTKPVSPEDIDMVYEKLNKLISKSVKDLLVVEDNSDQAESIKDIIGGGDVNITVAATAEKAYEHLTSGEFDCMILDAGLPDMSGLALLNRIRKNEDIPQLPVIVYTSRELTNQEKRIVDEYAVSIITRGANSQIKLLDETTLFLHRVEKNLPETQQKILRMIHDRKAVLTGKKILVVDDDMRNVFSIKKVLEDQGIKVLVGKDGKECLACLNSNPDVDLVLMDIMMPEMDGYTAIGEIRKQERFKKLPVIALTAKAMKGDRAECIEAGANDYLAKPFEMERLFSMLRVWLY